MRRGRSALRFNNTCSTWVGSILIIAGAADRSHPERDVFANQAREHGLVIRDRLVEVHVLRYQHLLAAERQQLLRQRRGTRPRLLNCLEVGPLWMVAVAVAEEQLCVAKNRGEQIIEVVRDASSEPSNGLDPCGLRETLFEPALPLERGPLGLDARADIDHEPAQLGQRAAGIELADDRFDDVGEPAVAAAKAAAMVLDPPLFANAADEGSRSVVSTSLMLAPIAWAIDSNPSSRANAALQATRRPSGWET